VLSSANAILRRVNNERERKKTVETDEIEMHYTTVCCSRTRLLYVRALL